MFEIDDPTSDSRPDARPTDADADTDADTEVEVAVARLVAAFGGGELMAARRHDRQPLTAA